MTTLIMSCAGKSTRFNLNRPKIFLTHPSGNLMLMEAIYGLGDFSNVDRIVITVVKEHVEKSQVNLGLIQGKIKDTINILPEFLILNNFTKSQSETVEKTIKAKNIT
jgi:2-C-methyl-D-erythritol 4-phosphate cytidylyltransferase